MRYAVFLLAVLFLLSGCSAPVVEVQQPEAPQPEATFFRESSVDHIDSRWTEDELLTAFYQYVELGTVVIDCVVLESSACDIVGVVQYTQEGETGCWFDFLDSQGTPRSTGSEASPAGEDTLICAGVDTVRCSLLDDNGEEFVCEVLYFEELDGNTSGFKMVSR